MSYPTAEVYGPVTASADCKNCHKDLHGQGQTAYQVVVRHSEGYNAYSLFLCTGCLGEDVGDQIQLVTNDLNDMRQEDDPVPPQDTTSLCVGCDEPLKVENDAFLCPTCAVENNIPNCETCKSAYHETGDPACPFKDLTA